VIQRPDRGQATVEFALVLPLVVVLLAGLVQVGHLVGLQVAVIDAARAGARAASVDPRKSVAETAARAALASGERLEVHLDVAAGRPRVVTVTVTETVHPFGSALTIRGTSTMATEETAAESANGPRPESK
jgi:Flp pilus assembly protein TadG